MSEMDELRRRWAETLRKDAEDRLAEQQAVIRAFTITCSERGLDLETKDFDYFQKVGVVAQYQDLLSILCPELETDKDGLYDFGQLRELFRIVPFMGEGLLFGSDYILMAHPFFRRGMNPSQNWSPRFIDLFWKLNKPDISARIALDTERVRLDVKTFGIAELDTWFGAGFSGKITDIKDGPVELRPPVYLDQFDLDTFFGSAYSLHIKWATSGNIKTFQAEAYLSDHILVEWADDLWHPVQYIHAEYDLKKEHFRHFDGALHFYQIGDYNVMRDADLNYNLKNNEHIKAPTKKMFRLDGEIPLTIWLELTSHFFSKNPLITEYFEGKYPPHIEEVLEKARKTISEKKN